MARELRHAEVDEDVLKRLERRAALHGRSVEDELRSVLEAVGGGADPEREAASKRLSEHDGAAERAADFAERAAALRRATSGRRHTPSEVLQREGRDER